MSVGLPRDAEGREIPLDTEVLYDKNYSRRVVDFFKFYPDTDRWNIVFKDSYVHFSPNNLSLTKPDSWKMLLDDLDNAAEKASSSTYLTPSCVWFNDGNRGCTGCPADESPNDSCNVQLVKNIAARIRKLAAKED